MVKKSRTLKKVNCGPTKEDNHHVKHDHKNLGVKNESEKSQVADKELDRKCNDGKHSMTDNASLLDSLDICENCNVHPQDPFNYHPDPQKAQSNMEIYSPSILEAKELVLWELLGLKPHPAYDPRMIMEALNASQRSKQNKRSNKKKQESPKNKHA